MWRYPVSNSWGISFSNSRDLADFRQPLHWRERGRRGQCRGLRGHCQIADAQTEDAVLSANQTVYNHTAPAHGVDHAAAVDGAVGDCLRNEDLLKQLVEQRNFYTEKREELTIEWMVLLEIVSVMTLAPASMEAHSTTGD